MTRRPFYRSRLLQLTLIIGVGALVLAPAVRGCSEPTGLLLSVARRERASLQRHMPPQRRTALQRRTGPPPHHPEPPAPGAIRLTGGERLGWEQEGTTLDEVKRWHYVLVVGLSRHEMKDVKCEAPKNATGPFVCSGLLPPLEQGNHELRIIAIEEKNGHQLASPWSRPILVFKP